MKKQYVTLKLNFVLYKEDIVRTSEVIVDGDIYGDDNWFED